MYNEVHIHMYGLGVGNASDPIIQVTIANHQLMLIFSVFCDLFWRLSNKIQMREGKLQV